MNKIWTVAFLGLLSQWTFGQLTYNGCSEIGSRDNNFSFDHIISQETDQSLNKPIKMDFLARDDGNVDIYFTQQTGEIKKYDGGSGAISEIGSVDSHWDNGKQEDGLIGIALSPTFKEDNHLYVYYSHTQDGYRISRLTLNNGQLGNEVVMIKIPSSRGRWHTSGSMRFDDYGNLWVTVGDNEQMRKGPASTADMRGGILRIHPEPDGSYTIPDGNLWEFAAAHFEGQGDNATADEYRDENKMKREIYAMGTRNAYTLTLDPVRQWAMYGDCGPDTESGNQTDQGRWTEEHTIVTEPGFLGWPYYAAVSYYMPDVAYGTGNESYWGAGIPANAPTNTDNQSGSIEKLMPVVPGTYNYAHSCAMSGPIYRYDGSNSSSRKLPPHFNNKWLVSDFQQNWIRAISVTENGGIQGNPVTLFQNNPFSKIIDFQVGPDGALYVLQHSCGTWYTTDDCSGIIRIGYNGDCEDPNLQPARSGCKDPSFREYDEGAEFDNPAACKTPSSSITFRKPKDLGIQFSTGYIEFTKAIKVEIAFRDISGKLISGQSIEGPARLAVPKHSGVLIAQFTTSEGGSQKRITGF